MFDPTIKPGCSEVRFILAHLTRTSHAANIQGDVLPQLIGKLLTREDVADGQSTAGLEQPEHFGENGLLVRIWNEVDDAVADDAVGGVVGKWDGCDGALDEFDIGCVDLGFVCVGFGNHVLEKEKK